VYNLDTPLLFPIHLSLVDTIPWVVVRTVVAPPLSVVECWVRGFVHVVVCLWCCSCRVVVCVTCFSSYGLGLTSLRLPLSLSPLQMLDNIYSLDTLLFLTRLSVVDTIHSLWLTTIHSLGLTPVRLPLQMLDNIYNLDTVPIATVQLRFDGWVTEMQVCETGYI